MLMLKVIILAFHWYKIYFYWLNPGKSLARYVSIPKNDVGGQPFSNLATEASVRFTGCEFIDQNVINTSFKCTNKTYI